MELPKQILPIYELKLPSSSEKVLYHPFTVKEEKLLLMAIDDEDETQIRALRQVLDNCLLPNEKGKKLDVLKLATFDLDYLWLKIRSKSIEEIVTLPFECQKQLPESEWKTNADGEKITNCGTVVNVPINFDKIEVIVNPENQKKIELRDSIFIILKFPTFETLSKINKYQANKNDFDACMEVIMDCLEMIYDGKTDKTYEREYIETPDLLEFLENLSQSQFQKIMNFFDTLPVLRHKVHFKCPKCKYEVDVFVEGTKTFLA
jgi:T4 bacteriophage base plate protein